VAARSGALSQEEQDTLATDLCIWEALKQLGAHPRQRKGDTPQQWSEAEMKPPGKSKVAAERNPYNGKWELGWKWENGDFTPEEGDYHTRKEAEAAIPGFEERTESRFKAWQQERDAEIAEENERFPNLAYVRERIGKMRDPFDAMDAHDRLRELLNRDLHERITWPLPSWKVIRSGRVYGR
jgi:hypothetical protein